jgi:hypothetical protein
VLAFGTAKTGDRDFKACCEYIPVSLTVASLLPTALKSRITCPEYAVKINGDGVSRLSGVAG